ncbi:alpha/beta fold hydrolase, partial [Aquimonas sp.]|uniref:alpha/beta fold hydrolase n=1 Tax=Aquimonas sp. TaxID=1872588 RepID=UPI0037C02B9C
MHPAERFPFPAPLIEAQPEQGPRAPALRRELKTRWNPAFTDRLKMNILARNNVHIEGDSGPVLLYAHGFGCNQNMWSRVTPAFASTHRQVLFDYVGSGKSDLSAFNAERYASLQGYAQPYAPTLHETVTQHVISHSRAALFGDSHAKAVAGSPARNIF